MKKFVIAAIMLFTVLTAQSQQFMIETGNKAARVGLSINDVPEEGLGGHMSTFVACRYTDMDEEYIIPFLQGGVKLGAYLGPKNLITFNFYMLMQSMPEENSGNYISIQYERRIIKMPWGGGIMLGAEISPWRSQLTASYLFGSHRNKNPGSGCWW